MKNIAPVNPDYFVPNRFQGKVMLITGAATGIGAATAIRAAREGASVVSVDRKQKELQETVARIKGGGHKAVAINADVSITADADRMVSEAVAAFGGIDLVLNAAGVMDGTDPAKPFDPESQLNLLPKHVHEATDEYWDAVFASNITGMFKSMRSELRQMVAQERGGAIVNIGSIAGIIGLPGNPAYNASKYAVTGLTRNAAIDYAPYGIRINSVNMAQTDTPMVERAYAFVKWAKSKGSGASMAGLKTQSLIQAANPKHPGATPWEQAATILFLLSDDASNITGAAYATDGGWTTY